MHPSQILAKRGLNSRFVVKANFKLLMSKSNQGSILIPQICVNTNGEFYPGSKLLDISI